MIEFSKMFLFGCIAVLSIFLIVSVVKEKPKQSQTVHVSLSSPLPSPTPQPTVQEPKAFAFLRQLAQEFATAESKNSTPSAEVRLTVFQAENSYYDIQNSSVRDDNSEGILITLPSPTSAAELDKDAKLGLPIDATKLPQTQQMLQRIDAYFREQQFMQIHKGSGGGEYHHPQSDLWCLVNVYPTYDVHGILIYVSCSDRATSLYEKEKSIYPIVRKAFPDRSVSIEKIINDYVALGVISRGALGGGEFVLGQIKNGVFNAYYTGQDVPPCSIIDKYKIPGALIRPVLGEAQCFDDTAYQQQTIYKNVP